ncbi:MAG: amidase, partial [Proteobacteria bacterium]|nr:amidase [Pseudomonadota bacterium]
MSDLLYRPVVELRDLMDRRELSPVELMEATLARIDATQESLNAFSALRDPDAVLGEAREAEARIGRGEARLLEGIPLGVKDLEDAQGLVTSYGSVPFKDNLATRDSIQVERLRAAGAIVVGKTNAPEFGYTAITKNLLFGVTRNPWDLERSPGGSSGGSSAAIAGGVIPLATASDGGGSVRIPASLTGCFGLKISYGRMPNGPKKLWVMDDTAVDGPLTRCV